MSDSKFISIIGGEQHKDVDRTRLETCKHRSKEPEKIQEQGCCSKKTVEAYKCLLFALENVKPKECNECGEYEKLR